MRRARILAAAAALAATVCVPTVAASAVQAAAAATPVLTLNALGGVPAAAGDLLTSSLLPGSTLRLSTAPGGSVGLSCPQSSWQGVLLSNPAVPGPAALKLSAPFTFALCTDTNPTVTSVTSVSLAGLPAILQVNGASPFAIQILPGSTPLTITANIVTASGAVTCVYQSPGPILGSTTPGLAPWNFTNQPFNLVSGPTPACGTPPTEYFSARYYSVIDTTAGNAGVYVN